MIKKETKKKKRSNIAGWSITLTHPGETGGQREAVARGVREGVRKTGNYSRYKIFQIPVSNGSRSGLLNAPSRLMLIIISANNTFKYERVKQDTGHGNLT